MLNFTSYIDVFNNQIKNVKILLFINILNSVNFNKGIILNNKGIILNRQGYHIKQ